MTASTAANSGTTGAGEPGGSATPTPGRREMRRREREGAILQAARELMTAQGYDAMTMDELAAQAGISKPTLYQHFPSKEAIAIRAVVDLMARARAYIVGLDSNLPALQRLEMVIREVIRERFEHGRFSFGPAARAALVPAIKSNPDYRQEIDGMIASICGIVDEAKAEGGVNAALPTRLSVQMLFSIMRDAEYEELIARGEYTPGFVADFAVAILLDGMRVRRNGRDD